MGKFSKALEKASYTKGTPGPGVKPAPSRRQPEKNQKTGKSDPRAAFDADSGPSKERWERRLQLSTAPNSIFFESFRRLRSSIMNPSSGTQAKTFLVTSTVPHEGKGFVCANLGIALSRGMENNAMMVDCDLRHPTLARFFGISADSGLADYLQDDNADLSQLIRKTGQAKLSLLPAGRPPSNPAELLESAKMGGLILEMAERYPDRMILFDSAPGVIAAETLSLAKHVDAVILVVRYGASKKEAVKNFVDTLGREKIHGVVFNAYPENAVEAFLGKKLGYGYDYYNY